MNCPQCGDDNWRAHYMAAVNQPCTMEQNADGTIEASFSEPGEIVEEQPTESYSCSSCGYLIPAVEKVTAVPAIEGDDRDCWYCGLHERFNDGRCRGCGREYNEVLSDDLDLPDLPPHPWHGEEVAGDA